jgi:kynurenine formamidase
MCSPKVMSVVEQETARRRFLRSMGAAAVGLGAAAVGVHAQPQSTGSSRVSTSVHFETVVDLTHVLEPNVPNYFRLNMEITPVLTIEQHGVFVNRLTVPEHYGTHFDTPAHFIRRGKTGESIEPKQLVGHLVIIDIAERSSLDPNAEITVADLEQWEAQNGRIPPGAFVAMYSNWAKRWPTAAYLNEDDTGTYNFPGFGGDAARFLVEERDIIGIGCDSHSLDVGPSNSYPAHFAVLGAGKIGVENLAGLDEVLRRTDRRKQAGDNSQPLIFIGGLKTRGGSGSPVRALALV